jgi:hypothetical protein
MQRNIIESNKYVDDSWQVVEKNTKRKNDVSYISDNNLIKKKDNKNHKKILCHNIITNGICSYANKCLYAHSLEDQNVDFSRQYIYKLFSSSDLSDIDLQKNHSLYKSLLTFTKMCELCARNKCTGGYNCKFGACIKTHNICIKDLNYGDCVSDCNLVHLTNNKLKPFYYNINKTVFTNEILLTEDFFKKEDNQIICLSDSDESVEEIDEFNQSIFS